MVRWGMALPTGAARPSALLILLNRAAAGLVASRDCECICLLREVRADGRVQVRTHPSNPAALRRGVKRSSGRQLLTGHRAPGIGRTGRPCHTGACAG